MSGNYYDLTGQLADEVAVLQGGGGGTAGGDLSGTLGAAVVQHVLSGQTPVTTTTALSGDLSGTVASATVPTVRGGHTPLIGSDAPGGVLGGTYGAPTLQHVRTVKASFGAKGGGQVFTSGGSITGAGPYLLNDATHSPFTAAVSGSGAVVILPGAGSGGRNFSTAFTYISATQIQLTSNPPNPGGFGGAYQFGFDDSSALATGVSGAGTVPVVWDPDVYFWTTLNPKAGGAYYGYGATVYKIPGNINAVFRDATIDGTTLRVGLVIEGFTAYGEGIAGYTTGDQQAQNFLSLNQWTDVHIVHNIMTGFFNACLDVRDCQRVWYVRNEAFNSCINTGRNVMAFGDSSSGGSLPCSDFFALYNTIDNCHAEGIAMAIEVRAVTLTNVIVSHNRVTMATSGTSLGCVSVELNTSNAAGESARKIVISINILTQPNTASNGNQCCIFFQDDTPSGGTPSNDPTKIQDVVVQGNNCESAATATGTNGNGVLTFFASAVAAIGNVLRATGSCSRCIYVVNVGGTPGDSTVMSWVTLLGNQCHASSTAGVSNIVEIRQCNHWQLLGGIIESASTTSGDAVKVGSCQYWEIGGGLRIITPAANGINLGTWKDGIIDGVVIYNVNNANNAGTGLGNGILYSGSAANLAGFFNAIFNAKIWDDGSRAGGKQMLFGFQNAIGSATTKIHTDNWRIIGAKTNPWPNGTIASTIAEFGRFFTDAPAGIGLDVVSNTIGAASVILGPYAFDVAASITAIGTITGWTYQRPSGGTSTTLGAPTLGDSTVITRGDTITVATSGSTGTVATRPLY